MKVTLKSAETAKQLRLTLEQGDELNARLLRQGLQEENDRSAAFESELSRLTEKYGEKSEQVAGLKTRIEARGRLKAELADELEMASLPLPKISAKEAVVYGVVLDSKRKGVEKLDVLLFGQAAGGTSTTPAPNSDKGVTGKGGYFELRLAAATVLQATLEVRKASRVLYRDRAPRPLEPGKAHYREVTVDVTAEAPKPTKKVATREVKSARKR
jgi:hypothetical protein